MEVKELMIGDLVYYSSYLDLNHQDITYVSLIDLQFIEEGNHKIIYKPIPITGEILLKNGFIDEFNIQVYSLNGVTLREFNNAYELVGNKLLRINYVHELQHLLKLFGLKDLACNFRIE